MLLSKVAGNDVTCSNSVLVCRRVTSSEMYRIPQAWAVPERQPPNWCPDVFPPLLQQGVFHFVFMGDSVSIEKNLIIALGHGLAGLLVKCMITLQLQ